MRLHKNNKGMTLIELIISIAISAIILSMVFLIISSASNGFRRTNDEVNLQLEAQTTINQMTGLIMEAKSVSGSSLVPEPESDNKKYIVTYSDVKNYAILFIKDKKRLFLVDAGNTDANLVAYSETDFMKQYLMAEYVSDFSITVDSNKATIDISFALGNDTYSESKSIKLRNAH